MKRRDLLKSIGLTAGTVALSGVGAVKAEATAYSPKRKQVLRIAHITDVHMKPEQDAPNRFRKCLEVIRQHKVDFFLNGGDTVFAADYGNITRERVHEQWNTWHQLRKEFNEYEMYSCLGNHDMWWAAPDKTDTMYGKDYAMQQLGIPRRYYSFDKKGWHFVVLDSNNKNAGSLDDEQRTWLEKDLAALPAGTPTLLMSHYPLLAACCYMDGGGMHTDYKYLVNLFYTHKEKVKACISGHIHLLDSVVYNNVQYYCNGALSGYWWGEGDKTSAGKGYCQQTPPGYAIIDLFDDGTVRNEYHPHSF